MAVLHEKLEAIKEEARQKNAAHAKWVEEGWSEEGTMDEIAAADKLREDYDWVPAGDLKKGYQAMGYEEAEPEL